MKQGIKNILQSLEIYEKRHEFPNALSGGMKRKLCLAMALIGNTKVLILDEPTSGMDVESRRKVWNLLLEKRKDATILISTHFMEEAEILGDHLAILNSGRIQAEGTLNQLKRQFKIGNCTSLLLKSKTYKNEIEFTIKKHFPNVIIECLNNNTIKFILEMQENKREFINLLRDLEQNQRRWNITSIHNTETTMNDIFLKAADSINDDVDDYGCDDLDLLKFYNPATGFKRCFRMFGGLLLKRWYFLKKIYLRFAVTNFLALAILILALWMAISSTNCYSDCTGGPCLKLNLEAYKKPTVYFGSPNNFNSKIDQLVSFYKTLVETDGGRPELRENVSEAIIQAGIDNIALYRKHLVVAAEFSVTNENEILANAMYSIDALHSVPISINLVMNSIAKMRNVKSSIHITNTPLKLASKEVLPQQLVSWDVIIEWTILFSLSITFLLSIVLLFPHAEICTRYLEMQKIAGVKVPLYWLTNILFDSFCSVLQVALVIGIFWVLNDFIYGSSGFQMIDIMTLAAIFAFYSFTLLPSTYLLSSIGNLAEVLSFMLVHTVNGIISALALYVFEKYLYNNYKTITSWIKIILTIVYPPFGLSYTCTKFSAKFVENFNWAKMDTIKKNNLCQEHAQQHLEILPCCIDEDSNECRRYQNYFLNDELGILQDFTLVLFGYMLWYLILWILNFSKNFNCTRNNNLDLLNENVALKVDDLGKNYKNQPVVDKLNFTVQNNQCYGLLGVNGAGKTTTFQMLSKLLQIDRGFITLRGTEKKNIPISSSKYWRNIGYCPQENYLNFYLTGRELITTTLLIKGYSRQDANCLTGSYLKYFGLQEDAEKPCKQYSGGNKRKLSTCLAFLGRPKVTLLDEPTSGVDPISQRKIWNILSKMKKNENCSFVLSSHSMEECENLCDELSIMKEGKIKTSGSILWLKDRFQNGLKIDVKLAEDFSEIQLLNKHFALLNANLIESYNGTCTYWLKDYNKKLSQLFSEVEDLKQRFVYNNMRVIEDYTIRDVSLEDVFLEIGQCFVNKPDPNDLGVEM